MEYLGVLYVLVHLLEISFFYIIMVQVCGVQQGLSPLERVALPLDGKWSYFNSCICTHTDTFTASHAHICTHNVMHSSTHAHMVLKTNTPFISKLICEDELRRGLGVLDEWCREWVMKVNADKCGVMHIRRRGIKRTTSAFSVGGSSINWKPRLGQY